MKSYLFLLFLSIFIISCNETTIPSDNPCLNVTCSNHGECTNDNGKPWCICESKYKNNEANCIFKCFENSHVNDTNDGCVCNEGFESENGECVITDPCDKLACGDDQHCEVIDNTAECICPENYMAVEKTCIFDCSNTLNSHANDTNNGCVCDDNYHKENNNCKINPSCDDIDCGDHQFCELNNNEPTCFCDDDYHFVGNVCTPNPTCDNVDCGINSHCEVIENETECICDENYHIYEGTCALIPNCNLLSCDDNQICQIVDNLAICQDAPSGCDYYQTVFDNNLTGTDMLRELHNIISINNISLGYDRAKEEMFGYIDNENNQVLGVYSGEYYQNQEGTMPNQNVLNCEHTWPQSQFGRGEPMRSDLHHLFPTFSTINSSRSHHPFGEVDNPDKVFGTCNTNSPDYYCSKLEGSIFEPADQHKGNVARAMLYFAVRYGNLGSSEYPKFLDAANQKETFLRWNIDDPVDQKEIDRNNAIFLLQNNRNPFVDCPVLLERVNSTTDFPGSY